MGLYSILHRSWHDFYRSWFIKTSACKIAAMLGVHACVLLALIGCVIAESEPVCDIDYYFWVTENSHVVYGIPIKDAETSCACMEACRADNDCKAFDYNHDEPPYQNVHCWLHHEEGLQLPPFMHVTHFDKKHHAGD